MYLLGHLQDVYVAALRILDATGEDQLHALGLDSQVYFPRFRRCVLLAAAVHDIGKANSHFQDMITGKRNILQNPQGLRHEWVTVLMLQSLKIWLLPAVGGNETDFAIVAWAVAGHHPAVTHQSPPTTCPENAGVDVTFLLNCNDGLEIIGWLSDVFREAELAARGRSRFSRFRPLKSSGKQWVDSARNDFCHGLLGPLPAMQNLTRSLAESDDVFTEIAKLWGRAWRVWDSAIAETDDRKLLAAVKDCLIAADIAVSALQKAFAD
jgi:CRISPR-associated endonuclease/helicase Cas3